MGQDLVNIGNVIVHGILFDPKNTEAWRNMAAMENIYKSVPRLFDLLEQRSINYVLVGGIAMLAYIDGRNTQDIDLIVTREDLIKLPEIRVEDEKKDLPAVGSATCGSIFSSPPINCSKKSAATIRRSNGLPSATCAARLSKVSC